MKNPRQNPVVSVIIPAFRVAPFIQQTLDSVFAQTFVDYEIIVINDGSPDTEELRAILRPYIEKVQYIEQENRGVSGARNRGIEASRGELIALLDGDDIWLPNYLAEQVAFLRNHPEYDLVYCDAEIFGDSPLDGKRYMDYFPSVGEADFAGVITRRCHVFNSVTMRRQASIAVGEFDESLRSCEDFDYWLRFTSSGHRIGYQSKLLVCYRKHGTSLSTKRVTMAESNLKVLGKTLGLYPTISNESELIRRAQRMKRAELHLIKAKMDILAGEMDTASIHLLEANEQYRSKKIELVVRLLAVFPGLIRHLYSLRRSMLQAYREGVNA